jgi:hypothetical protein
MNETVTQGARRIGFVASLDVAKRHRLWIFLCAAVAAALAIVLAIHGWSYYTLDQAHRPFSPKHVELRPGGRTGLRLGITGFALFAMVYLYPLRKRWHWLQRFGKTKHWLDYHVLLGLVAPVFITFHSSFKIQGFAGMAYWTMLALMTSGIIGRYFYAQIPRRIGDAEMSLKEMQDLSAGLVEDLSSQHILATSDLERLFQLPDARQVQSMSIPRALANMVFLDLVRPFRVWALRRRGLGVGGVLLTLGGILPTRNAQVERAVSLASRRAALGKRILFLSKTHRVFHLWHVIHRPFSLTFAILVILHVGVVLSLGYF